MSVMQKDMTNHDDMRMEWDPFSDEQIAGLFFPGAGRAEMIEQLQHLLRYGPTVTLLAGEAGVGKRMLTDQLLQELDRDLFDVADVQATVMMTFEQLLSRLDEPWRSLRPITLDNYADLVPAIAGAADDESKTLLCVVRDADQIEAAAIDLLKAMLANCAGLPVKFLLVVGVSELERAPAVHGLVDSLPDSGVLYLDPFTAEQTAEYLQYRLHTAGLGQVKFNARQLDSIYAESHGNAGKINAVARELLMESMPAPKLAAPRAKLPTLHLAALGVVAVLLTGLLLMRQGGDDAGEAQVTRPVVLENAVQTGPAAETFPEVARVAEESLGTSVTQDDSAPAPASSPSLVAGPDQTPTPVEAAVTADPTPTAAIVSANSSKASADLTPAAKVAEPGQTASAASEPAAAVPAQPVVKAEPAPKSSVKPSSAPASKPVATVDPRVKWLRGLPPSHYVLQILGANEEATVKRFLSQYPSLQKVAYYRTWRQGKPWYVVVQGDYVDYEAAKNAIGRLPAQLRQQNPWIRKVELVQRELKV